MFSKFVKLRISVGHLISDAIKKTMRALNHKWQGNFRTGQDPNFCDVNRIQN